MTEVIAKPKKAKWWHNVLSIVILLWFLGGVEVFLLRDIPLLLVFGTTVALANLPVARWLGKPESRWIAPVWGCAVIVTIIALLLFVIPPFFISRQTTYLTEPRSTEFYGIDYLTAIEKRIEPSVPPEDNGFRLLLEKFGRPLLADYSDENWNYICTKLSVPLEMKPSATFVDWYAFTKALPEEERKIVEKNYCEDIPPPFSEEQLPFVKRWLDENNQAIEIFVEAIQKPAFYAPPTRGKILSHSMNPSSDIARTLTRILSFRIRYRLTTGDIVGAWDDVLFQFRLAETQRPAIWHTTLFLMNTAAFGDAVQSADSVLLYGNWTTNEIRSKILDITPFLVPPTETELETMFLGNRFMQLDTLQKLSSGTWAFDDFIHTMPAMDSSAFEQFIQRNFLKICRWENSMKDINRKFDKINEKGLESIIKTDSSNKKLIIEKTFLLRGLLGTIPSCIAIIYDDSDFLEMLYKKIQHREVAVMLSKLLFSLELYRREHEGKYPESLDELRNGYIDVIPFDPFSEQPFLYVLDDDRRGCLIYSVGSNGIDENGRNNNGTPKGDDVHRRIRLPVD
jgi:hypothetical protein